MPSAAEAKALFRAFLRQGRNFHNYNVKEYIIRRAKEGFRQARTASNAEALFSDAKAELEVMKRQSMVYQLYARKTKNVLELDLQAAQHRPMA